MPGGSLPVRHTGTSRLYWYRLRENGWGGSVGTPEYRCRREFGGTVLSWRLPPSPGPAWRAAQAHGDGNVGASRYHPGC